MSNFSFELLKVVLASTLTKFVSRTLDSFAVKHLKKVYPRQMDSCALGFNILSISTWHLGKQWG